ncbi:hypothetical protein MMC14_007922 [Varicellaria rhodocarpa]|nr:hypothetical protein [Varicellaria rhodocarpa]
MANDTTSHEYVLGRSFRASARLNLQHYLWTQELGYLIHPSIPQEGKLQIADIGTGTGVWLLDLAHKLPLTQLDGFDINISQAPPAEWLPSNVKMYPLDVFADIPPDLLGKYDIVHIRLFMCVVRNNDPELLLKNLLKLLKPGGWLQWGELDLQSSTFVTANPLLSADSLKDAAIFPRSLGSTDTRMDPSWVPSLPEIFEKNGLRTVSCDHKPHSLSHLPFMNDINVMTWEEMKDSMNSKDAQTYASILAKFGEFNEKAQRGVAMNIEKWVVVGKK